MTERPSIIDVDGNILVGRYRAKAIKSLMGATKKGQEQVGVELRFSDYPDVTVWWYGFFKTDTSFDMSFKAFTTLGWTGTELTELECPDEESVSIVFPNEVLCAMQLEEIRKKDPVTGTFVPTGRMRSRCAFINPIGMGGGIGKPLSEDARVGFSDKMKDRIAAAREKAGQGADQGEGQGVGF